MGECKHMGASKHTGGVQTDRGIQMYGGIWTPLSLKRYAFFVLCMYRGYPNIWGHPTLCGVSKHTGGIQTHRGIQTYGGVQTYREAHGRQPNIQGAIQTYGEIPTYRGHPNIWGIQMYGAYGHPLSLTKHAFFVCKCKLLILFL